jgi:hypothetical protein
MFELVGSSQDKVVTFDMKKGPSNDLEGPLVAWGVNPITDSRQASHHFGMAANSARRTALSRSTGRM